MEPDSYRMVLVRNKSDRPGDRPKGQRGREREREKRERERYELVERVCVCV